MENADAPDGPETHVPAPRGPVNEPPPAEPPAAEPLAAQPLAAEPLAAQPPALTERDQQILDFERRWWKHAGSKEQAIRDTFALSATRYYQLLNGLLDNPAALERDPQLVSRLRRLRSARARTRRR